MTFSTMLSTMSVGMLRTCGIFFLTLLGALPLGMVVCLLRRSTHSVVRTIIKIYISIMRGTPLMLQLLVWYFGPYYLFRIPINGWRFPAIVVGFVMNYAAYFAEIYRSGIDSMPIGQYEAAEVLGYTKGRTFFKIILPQVIKRILPAVTNEVITLVKDTSLASVIAVVEMFTLASRIAVAPHSPGMVTFAVAAVFYYVFNYVVAFGMERAEKALSYYQ